MRRVSTMAAALYLALIDGLMPTAFLLQGPTAVMDLSSSSNVPPGCGSSVSAGEDSTGSIAAALDPIPHQPQRCRESLGSNMWGRVKRRGSGNTSRLRTGSTDLPSTLVLANITLLPNRMGPKTPFFPPHMKVQSAHFYMLKICW